MRRNELVQLGDTIKFFDELGFISEKIQENFPQHVIQIPRFSYHLIRLNKKSFRALGLSYYTRTPGYYRLLLTEKNHINEIKKHIR
jgi:hypothetical protein